MIYRISTFTDNGSRRVNEDSFGIAQKADDLCLIVCDGLGGHGMGDKASNLVKDVFINYFYSKEVALDFIPRTFEMAQLLLSEEQQKHQAINKMRTTATVLIKTGTGFYAGHIGDTRLYAFLDGRIVYQTVDHSVPQMLALAGRIEPEEIRHHPERNVLLRALGTEWEKPMYEIEKLDPKTDYDAFLLCSDGFWEYIDENKMSSLQMGAHNTNEWLNTMIEEVKANGFNHIMDNFTAIAVMKDN